MGWYDELLLKEEEERRKAAGEYTAPPIIPESFWKAREELRDEVRRRMGTHGEPGPPMPPPRLEFGPSIDPYTAQMIEPSDPLWWSRELPKPPTPPRPAPGEQLEARPQDRIKAWNDFVAMGGVEAKYQNADGSVDKMKHVPPKNPMEEAQKAQQKAIVGKGGAQPTQQAAATLPVPAAGPVPPIQIPPELQNIMQQQKDIATMYQGRFGERPPRGWREQEEDLRTKALQREEEQRRIIEEANPELGKLIHEAKLEQARYTTKFGRVMRNILAMDPWYMNKEAGARAAWEQERLSKRGAQLLSLSERASERDNFISNFVMQQEEKERSLAHADLLNMLKVNPEYARNKKFMIDFAVSKYGYSLPRATQFVDQHYNPKTGTYDVALDPRRETVMLMTNGANTLLSIPGYEDVPRDVAMAMGADPAFMAKWSTDEIGKWEVKLAHSKNVEERRAIQGHILRLKVLKEELIKNPLVRNYVLLMEDYDTNHTKWGKEQLAEFAKKEADLWYGMTGAPIGQTTEDRILEREGKRATIANVWSDIAYRRALQQKEAEKNKEIPLLPSQEVIRAVHPMAAYLYRHNKSLQADTNKDVAGYVLQQTMDEDAVLASKPKDITKRQKADPAFSKWLGVYVDIANKKIPAGMRDTVGKLSPQESVMFMRHLDAAANGELVDPVEVYLTKLVKSRSPKK